MTAYVRSVNVGLPREVSYQGTTYNTGIFKSPVTGPLSFEDGNLVGDRQADLRVHGGPDKAIYAYPLEHAAYWSRELGIEIEQGHFGENLTVEGLLEDQISIGDELQIGSLVCAVTQPRVPCLKINVRFNRNDMIQKFLAVNRSGFYLRVLSGGQVSKNDTIAILRNAKPSITVEEAYRLFKKENVTRPLLERAIAAPHLSASWREKFEKAYAQLS